MIRVGVDARMIHHSGIGTYTRGILKHLTAMNDFDFTLFGDLPKIANYEAKKVDARFPIYSLSEQILFPMLLSRHPVDVLHVPHYNAPLAYRKNCVVTVHDLIHLRFPKSRLKENPRPKVFLQSGWTSSSNFANPTSKYPKNRSSPTWRCPPAPPTALNTSRPRCWKRK